MKLEKQINNLKIYDCTFKWTGIPKWRGIIYVVKAPNGKLLEEFDNTDQPESYDALSEAIKWCKATKDFVNKK